MKGMLLAAGLGTRLRPLSEKTPKPLMPVVNVPVIEYNLRLMKSHGIDKVFINLFHLGDDIEDYLGDGSRYEVSITYSHEGELLGTGGGIKKLESLLGPSTFVVMNADIISDADLTAAIRAHREHRALATMVVKESPQADEFGAIEYDEHFRLIQLAGKISSPPVFEGLLQKAVFTGVHVLEPRALEYIPPDIYSCINEYAYPKMIANNEPVYVWRMNGYWCDLGTPERLLQANLDVLSRKIILNHFDPLADAEFKPKTEEAGMIILGKNVTLEETASFEPPVMIGTNCKIGKGTRLGPGAIVGNGCQVSRDCSIMDSVILSGSKIKKETLLNGMITDGNEYIKVTGPKD
ncbi:MAG: NDP-sugar synthase [Deltaproteobacteria bacterium]|nr:NDP-sugar synthase [Deltaproteobacteria bacterium]